jgi:hypothetical protein
VNRFSSRAPKWGLAILLGFLLPLTESRGDVPVRKTVVGIDGQAFTINGRPTYAGRTYNGMKIEGLLLNSRMVQGIFDDSNPDTRKMWNYPDGPWDPERNTREFLAAMPQWRQHGLIAFTLCLQGGSPQGYTVGKEQAWINSAFNFEDGSLRSDYTARLEKILDKADELGMAVIVGYFYFGQENRFKDEITAKHAADVATDWILEKGYTNVLVEVANECNNKKYHEFLHPARAPEAMRRIQDRSKAKVKSPAGRLLVSTSLGGQFVPPDNIAAAADFLLIHGNGAKDPNRITEMVQATRKLKSYHHQPILFNEDDHFDFDKPQNNMLAALGAGAGWGFFDYRMTGEGFDDGYQSVPVNWGISSPRKHGFFELLEKMTGGAAGG